MRDEIIKMAREAGCVEDKHYKGEVIFISNDALERFFHMAQAAEREACARTVELEDRLTREGVAAAIRARGQA